MKEKWENLLEIIKLLMFFIMMGHIMAILYNFVALIDIELFGSEMTWLH